MPDGVNDQWNNYRGAQQPNWWTAPQINTDINTSLNFPNTTAPIPNGQLASNTSTILNEIQTERTENYNQQNKQNIFQKTGQFLTNNANTISQTSNFLNNTSDLIFGQKYGLDGPNAGLTQGIDAGYNAASDMMMKVNPMIGGAMKAVNFLGNTLNKAGGGTDGMTGVDAALNSGIGLSLIQI